jgi:hypothetical protein
MISCVWSTHDKKYDSIIMVRNFTLKVNKKSEVRTSTYNAMSLPSELCSNIIYYFFQVQLCNMFYFYVMLNSAPGTC